MIGIELGDVRIGEGAGKALVGRLTGCESAEWEGQWGGPPCGDGPVGRHSRWRDVFLGVGAGSIMGTGSGRTVFG